MTVPLETLLGLFQNPLHLIQKRKDKLLDYDHLRYALDHAEDSEKIAQLREEVLLAKRNYEALNAQLLEELPCFIEAVAKMLHHQLTALVQAQYNFTSSVAAIFPPLLPAASSATTPAEVEQQHAEELAAVCKELAKLSFVPASMSYIRTSSGVTVYKASDSNSPKNPSRPSSAKQGRTTGVAVRRPAVKGVEERVKEEEGEEEREEREGEDEEEEEEREEREEEEEREEREEEEREERAGEEGAEEQELSGEEWEDSAEEEDEKGEEGRRGREQELGEEEQELSGGEWEDSVEERGVPSGEEVPEEMRDRGAEEEELEGWKYGEKEEQVVEEVAESEVFENTPRMGTKLQVLFDFVSEDPSELSVVAGQVVLLVCPHDRIGCSDWWLVQAVDKQQGYVPATYLVDSTAVR